MARYRKVMNWTVDSVLRVCHENNFFTLREVEDFDFLVHCIRIFKPTDENIQTVAQIIYNCSDHRCVLSVSDIMGMLANYAVITHYIQIGVEED